jgi:ADP-heptose:LPS heptosyltransferase
MFASMVFNCDLFLCCDSGPMHLACALGVRTVAIFLLRYNSNRWAPPSNLARMVYQEGEASVSEVIDACRLELNLISRQRKIAKTVNA